MSQSYNWPRPGCVGLWHLNGDLNDGSGYDNHGYGTDIEWIAGKIGQGADLSSGAYIIIDDDASLHVTDFTLSAWYRQGPGGSGEDNAIYSSWGRYTGPTYYFYYGVAMFLSYGYLGVGIGLGSYGFYYYYGNTNLDDNRWHWCVTTPAGIYVDGMLDGEGGGSAEYYGTHIVRIGSGWTGAMHLLAGCVDEVCVLNRALSADEIRRAYLFQIGAL